MNQNPTPRWSPMVSAPEDEFASFLDFGELSFSAFDGIPPNDAELQQQNGAGPMDTSIEGGAGMLALDHEDMQQQMGQHSAAPTMNGYQSSTESFPDLAIHSELFEQQQRQQLHMQNQCYHGPNAVPPTPNSMELHRGHTQYYRAPTDHQQLHMYDHYNRNRKDQMIFTPLVSPAVTPLDTQFQYPEYAAPTDAFSPLSSPALRAQNQNHAAQQSVYGAVRSSDTSDTTSPIDPSLEYSAPQSASTPVSLRKSKRKTSSSSTKNPARAVRQSPAMKPQRKKQPSSTVIPPKEISGLIEEARKSKQSQAADGKLFLPYSQDSSGADSVSPEPLSEILMPPPATPRSNSAGRSPYLNAKPGQPQPAPVQDANGEPATPASLMKIRKQGRKVNGSPRKNSSLKEQTARAEADMEQIMEDMVLPEPANTTKKPALRPINTTDANMIQVTPTMSAKKPPRYGPSSAPITATGSAFPSPQLGPVASPNIAGPSRQSDLNLKLKTRDPKKRNSQSSIQVSPALRPKISPSIKPLLPEGAVVNAETSALLLASKSNYQNILEGTHLPGVSYPETLSTNLTSKRTSHKIAEQGRRNRINTALQEIASLLPPSTPQANGQGGLSGQLSPNMMMIGTAAQQSSSKASTVELAIDYIKSLQKELGEVKGRLEAVEKERGATMMNGDKPVKEAA